VEIAHRGGHRNNDTANELAQRPLENVPTTGSAHLQAAILSPAERAERDKPSNCQDDVVVSEKPLVHSDPDIMRRNKRSPRSNRPRKQVSIVRVLLDECL
jgi:hypothetical protein